MPARYFFRLFAIAVTCIFLFSTQAFAQTTAAVNGSVVDETGAPVSGVAVTLRGPATERTTTDAHGAFSFSGITPGIYALTASRTGYQTSIENDLTLLAGQNATVTVHMVAATFSSLQTIASVRTTNRGSLNTSPASVNVVTTQTFVDQGQPQVTRVLSQVPGLQISFPSNSANAAAPGAITVPNIRNATSYETASLIDGHPISVGQYGDNVTTFLNAFMFGSVEVVKGPGADALQVNNAIGGTTNFRTKDPTSQPYAGVLFGVSNHGGTISNFDFRDTVGKLGFVIDIATNNDPSALNGKSVYYDPSGGVIPAGYLSGNTGYTQIGNTQSRLPTQPQLLACCYTFDGGLYQNAQLYKLQYKFSQATRMTVSFMGSQTASDQNGNTGNLFQAQFIPGPGYTGSIPAGPLMYASIYPGAPQGEINNEPIFQAEASSTIGNNSILARFYTATVSRYQFGGTDPTGIDYNMVHLYGTSSGNGNVNQTFNGQAENVGYSDYYIEPELDKLKGASVQLQHPLGNNGVLTLSADRTFSQSTDYSIFPGADGPQTYYNNLFPGTSQILTTFLARGQFYIGSKLNLTLSDYFNTYDSTYAIGCPPNPNDSTICSKEADLTGAGVSFQTTRNTHNDPRLALVFRPNGASAIRFSAGSSIAPPFLGLLNQITSTPSFDANSGFAIESQSNGSIKPETGFGYDLGVDARVLDRQTVFSGDVYLTNLYNRFFGQTVNTGLTCAQVQCSNLGNVAPGNVPVLNQTNTNISNARFEGIELALRRQPAVGLGYDLSAALEKGYYYNLPPYFYCSVPGPGCTPDQNLNVIAGQNTNGLPVGFYNISYNGNMRIPYSQGNAEISYTFHDGAYVALGDTYYGKNNSLNEPPFGIGYATIRFPVTSAISLQLSGDNIFNAYSGILPVWGAGVPIDLYGGQTAATNGNVLGPATYRLILSTKLP